MAGSFLRAECHTTLKILRSKSDSSHFRSCKYQETIACYNSLNDQRSGGCLMFILAMIIIGLLSYLAGLSSYLYFLKVIYDQSLGSEIAFVIFATLLGFILIAYPAFMGIVYAVDQVAKKFKLLLYPLACIAIFFIPTLLILLIWGGVSPFSDEALLFYFFYIFSGLVFGIGYWLIQKMNLGRVFKSKTNKKTSL